MSEYKDIFTKGVINHLKEVDEKETENIKEASKIIVDAFSKKGILHVFATGHSHMFAEELFYRAGGLVPIDPILIPPLMQHVGAITSTKLERKSGLAKEIFDKLDLKDGEPFIIVSNSGINAVPIEMASLAKKAGHKVIVITSVNASSQLESRVSDKSHLYDYGDVVIDNHIPYGDYLIETKNGRTGSASSIVGAYIAQRIVLEVIAESERRGIDAPIFQSANIPNGDKHNKELVKEYQERIKPLC